MAPSRGDGGVCLPEETDWQRKKLEQEVVYLRGLVEKLIEGEPVELEPQQRPEPGNLEQEHGWLEGETQRLLCETVSLCKRARCEAAKAAAGPEEVDRLHAENKRLAADKNHLTRECERLAEDLACAEAERKRLESADARAQADLQHRLDELSKTSEESARLKADIDGLQKENEQLQNERHNTAQESARLKADIDSLQKENEQLQNERHNTAQEIAQLKEDHAHVQQGSAQYQLERKKSVEEIELFKSENCRLREEIEQLQAAQQISVQEITQLKEDNGRLRGEDEQFQTERQNSTQELARLEEENRSLAKASEHLDATSRQLAAENERLTEELARAQQDRDWLACLEAQARADAESHLERLAEVSQENVELTKANNDLKQERDFLAGENKRLSGEHERLAAELSHSDCEQRQLAEVEQNARADFRRHLQSQGGAQETLAVPTPMALAAEAPLPAAAQDESAAAVLRDSTPRSSSACSTELVGRRPSIPSTTSSMPQLLPSSGSGPLGSVPVLRDPPVVSRRLSDPWVYSEPQFSAESWRVAATGPAPPESPSVSAAPPEPAVPPPPGRGAPPLRPPVPVTSQAAVPAPQDRALASEAAARFVSSLVRAKERQEVAAKPRAEEPSATGPSVQVPLEVHHADSRGEEDQLLASRPTIPIPSAKKLVSRPKLTETGSEEDALNYRRRYNTEASARKFQLNKANTYTIGEADEDGSEEIEGGYDFAARRRSMPMAGSEFGPRRGHRRPKITGDVAELEALVLGGRPRQPSDASGAPLSSRLEALRELRRASEVPARRPLLQGLFVLATDKLGSPCLRFRWPALDGIEQDPLEDTIVGKGFCPGVEAFVGGAGGGEPFVFSLLETALDPQGDPNGVLYGCVCGDVAAPEPERPSPGLLMSQASKAKALLQRAMPYPTTKPQTAKDGNTLPSGSGWSLSTVSAPEAQASAVLCLVSRLPLFAFLFELLEILRGNLDSAAELLERVNSVGFCERLVSEGVDLGGLPHVTEGSCLRLQLPRPLLCDWQSLLVGNDTSPWSPITRTGARWQVAWALGFLMARWDNLVGDTLARLLACTLLEQKVLLLGDVPCGCAAALALRGLLWPFRWLHLFLSAPPPGELLDMPLFDGPFPLVICLSELPRQWGFRTPYELPPEAVAGILRHDYVHISPQLETLGGLRGKNLKLPAGRHAALLKQIVHTKQRLRKGDIDTQGAAELIQEAAEAEIAGLATLIKEYAAVQVEEARGLPKDASPKSLQERCTERAMQQETFVSWLQSAKADLCNEEALPFFRTFFGTQLCLDLLYEELTAQAKSPSGAEAQACEAPALSVSQLQ